MKLEEIKEKILSEMNLEELIKLRELVIIFQKRNEKK